MGSGSVIWERRKREKTWLKAIVRRIGSASGIRRTINATLPPFKSFRQITPSHRRHIPVLRERRIKGDGFLHTSGRKVPAGKCRIRKAGERGASAEKQKFNLSGSSGWISGRGLAVRFGSASFASLLVISFCWLGNGFLWSGELPFLLRF